MTDEEIPTKPETVRSLRLIRKEGRDLNRYVFDDLAHARKWLAQGVYHDSTLEIVDVYPLVECKQCRGEGYTRRIKVIGTTTIEEFMKSTG